LNLNFRSFQPAELNDGLSLSTPSSESMDSPALVDIYKEVYTDDDLWSMRSLLVFRNGKLVAESYLKDPEDITQKHLIWSCTKQVMGVLMGLALEEGLIDDLDDPLSKYLHEELSEHPDKKDIRLGDLLTMRSGIDFNNEGLGGETDKLLRQIPDSSLDFILNLPMRSDPGTDFHYNDGDPHLLSAVLQKQAGKSTRAWADEVFFSKIGFDNYEWLNYKDGITFGAFGIETTPRELAKIALCVADSGKWKGEQVVSSEWIRQMTQAQVYIEDQELTFGYYWWIDEDRGLHFMDGHGGQFAFIVPDKDLVIVMTAIPNTQGDFQIKADEALKVVDKILSTTH
jgi:CubicO group peptidase (beta-lactamase class C family)